MYKLIKERALPFRMNTVELRLLYKRVTGIEAPDLNHLLDGTINDKKAKKIYDYILWLEEQFTKVYTLKKRLIPWE